ncbi:MAG: ATP-dependent helicase [Candidatus Eremiobacteraeota bacterium]|nr:ATP-dependent helicase [Candidatus Eremiobacteraeota bacterium]
MRVEQMAERIRLTSAQQAIVDRPDAVILVSGPPACGKTTALAARALAAWEKGRAPVVICSHQSSCAAFGRALTSLGSDDPRLRASVATLAEHAARWLRSGYVLSLCAPETIAGGPGAGPEVVRAAARGLLDMTWPLFARPDLDLDLPHFGRPESFVEEAAHLFSLLQRARVSPAEFEEGCAAGLAAFYGQGVERAEVLIADPHVQKRASARGRAALRVPAQTLVAQRTAEVGLASILVQLYREYRAAAARASIRAPEDLIDALIGWLTADTASRDMVRGSIGEIIVDDAEDAEPALGALLRTLREGGNVPLVLAGNRASRVDGLEGRRSALDGHEGAARMELPPLRAPAPVTVQRLAGELDEVGWIAGRIGALLREGAAPETIAVLTRSDDAAVVYAMALRECGVPVVRPSAVLERDEEIADAIALCAVVDDPTDQEHLLRVLSSPLVGLCDAHVWALCRDPAESMQLALEVGVPAKSASAPREADVLARNMATGAADSTLPESTRERVTAFRERLAGWRVACEGLTPAARFIYIVAAAGFGDRWDQSQPYERERLHGDCRRVSRTIELAAQSGVQDFSEIARLLEAKILPLERATPVAGAIVADTIVAHKGGHFDHVFVAGVAHERFPRIYTSHAMAFSRTYGLIVRENVAPGAAHTAKFAWYYAKFGAKGMYLDEERRALGYALSRATKSACATGYGSPPHWARDHDLLATIAPPAGTGCS